MTDKVVAEAANFDRAALAKDAALAEAERDLVLTQFPLDGWRTLPLERYALGQESTEMTYCRLLEFRTLHLGSIKGGSAAKHIMYRHNTGEWRLPYALQDMPIEARPRDEITGDLLPGRLSAGLLSRSSAHVHQTAGRRSGTGCRDLAIRRVPRPRFTRPRCILETVWLVSTVGWRIRSQQLYFAASCR